MDGVEEELVDCAEDLWVSWSYRPYGTIELCPVGIPGTVHDLRRVTRTGGLGCAGCWPLWKANECAR